ncbi:MAG: hypothetical protein ACOH2H_16735 [Cypionkella sp.]
MDKEFDLGERDLDALFAEAAEMRLHLSPELAARILSDAAAAQPISQVFVRAVKAPVPQSRGAGWFAVFADVLGGFRSVAGLSLVGLMGLYLGVAQPSGVQSLTSLLAGDTTVEQIEFLPATGSLWTGE